jgi:23S rRNA-/tRNA-specific pseudouridylate synthase
MSRPVVRWVARAEAPVSLADVLRELGPGSDEALAAGRIFVDGRRVLAADFAVAPGRVVEIHRERAADAGVSVLFEHAGFVFVNKSPGIATEPDHGGIDASVVARVAAELGVGVGELHAVSRLDVGVSGVVTLARTTAARATAMELRARGAWQRRYVAVTSAAPVPAIGRWQQALGRPRHGRAVSGDERAAETRYAVAATAGPVFLPARTGRIEARPALLALAPVTGRTHQLRLHAAGARVPLLGDATYGGSARYVLATGTVRSLERVALHAAWVELTVEGRTLRIDAPPPADLEELWRELGGRDDDWTRALELEL